jgi:hypothetical protein
MLRGFSHSDSATLLQYGTGPFPVFLTKVLGVSTLLFLCNTQFYFLLSVLFEVVIPPKVACICSSSVASVIVFGAVTRANFL